MGHFVHSFETNVVAHNAEALEATAMDYVKSTLTLKQLRKGTTVQYMLSYVKMWCPVLHISL